MEDLGRERARAGKQYLLGTLFIVALLLSLLVQATPVDFMFSVTPNIPLTLCICFCLQRQSSTALVLSALCGLLQETLSGGAIGDCPLLYLLVGWLGIYICNYFYRKTLTVTLFLVLILTFLYSLLFWGIRYLVWGTEGCGQLVFCNMLPSAICNTAIAPFCAWLAGKRLKNREAV